VPLATPWLMNLESMCPTSPSICSAAGIPGSSSDDGNGFGGTQSGRGEGSSGCPSPREGDRDGGALDRPGDAAALRGTGDVDVLIDNDGPPGPLTN